jgi:hypothetical protein
VVAPHQRHRDADEARAFGRVCQQPLASPMTLLIAIIPASPPEISMATMMIQAD